ncbi:eukaryotic translation initiation factor 3 subunit A-like protein, partial [Tanacetum coccineum]
CGVELVHRTHVLCLLGRELPGCSSVGYGASHKIGPFNVTMEGKGLQLNQYLWNKACFSYSNVTTDYGNLGDDLAGCNKVKMSLRYDITSFRAWGENGMLNGKLNGMLNDKINGRSDEHDWAHFEGASMANNHGRLGGVCRSHVSTCALEEALDVDDLEGDNRPKDLMLSYVSGEKGKERSDRERVTTWFKFLWETYRVVLEILMNNSKLMALYADTTHRAFQFCKQYKRTTEFRHLCEIIRIHLANLNKYRDKRDRPDLSALESQHFFLDTRSEQTKLKLWQAATKNGAKEVLIGKEMAENDNFSRHNGEFVADVMTSVTDSNVTLGIRKKANNDLKIIWVLPFLWLSAAWDFYGAG